MIPFINRFHGHNSLDYTYKKGRTTRSNFVNIKTSVNNRRKNSRIAVVISKKVAKSAVMRNLVRRRVYEYIRLKINEFDTVRDVVIIITSIEIISLPHQELTDKLDQLFIQANIIRK